jgi:hypothetical protein
LHFEAVNHSARLVVIDHIYIVLPNKEIVHGSTGVDKAAQHVDYGRSTNLYV